MAVDTAPRRFSMLGFGDGWEHTTSPPDGASSDNDRATDLGLYYGFDYEPAAGGGHAGGGAAGSARPYTAVRRRRGH